VDRGSWEEWEIEIPARREKKSKRERRRVHSKHLPLQLQSQKGLN
jgi:hypothetical protein